MWWAAAVSIEPLLVAPAISVAATATAGIIPLGESKAADVNFHVRSNVKQSTPAEVHLDLPSGWQSVPQSAAFKADEQTLTFAVTPGNLAPPAIPSLLLLTTRATNIPRDIRPSAIQACVLITTTSPPHTNW